MATLNLKLYIAAGDESIDADGNSHYSAPTGALETYAWEQAMEYVRLPAVTTVNGVELHYGYAVLDNILSGVFSAADFAAYEKARDKAVAANTNFIDPAVLGIFEKSDIFDLKYWWRRSKWFYFYTGMNEAGRMRDPDTKSERPIRENGYMRFQNQTDNLITLRLSNVDPKKTEVADIGEIVKVRMDDSPSSNHYTVQPPNNRLHEINMESHNLIGNNGEDKVLVWVNPPDYGGEAQATILCDPRIKDQEN